MPDDTADGGARNRMMTGNVPGDRPDGGAFDAALGLNEPRQSHRDRAEDQSR
jgi:hypothetical protein